MKFRATVLSLAIGSALLTGCADQMQKEPAAAPTADAVLGTYADIALATYEDSLTTAKALQASVNTLLANPTEANLAAAKAAWKAARVPYQQSEAYRFGNAIVDDWEGRVNAWPLDEGLIDYVDSGYGSESDENPFYTANIVANKTVKVGGITVDASTINKKLLAETLHEIDDVEANVATGYHAIEFLLWGQDLNGTNPGAGNRPVTDFDLNNCTGGNCDRRRDYLSAATDLLVDDLEEMVGNWAVDGAARADLMAKGPQGGLSTILTGMGSLSYGELAGERTKLGLMLHDPEEEHDCFSDNTHWSHYYDAKGIQNVYLGQYTRVDGSVVKGASLSQLVSAAAPALDEELRAKLDNTEKAMKVMADTAEAGNPFDVLIGANNPEGNQIVQHAVDALTDQTESIEQAIAVLNLDGIELEGSDSLDNPTSVLAE
ncbi:imelysin family protein [Pontibacterium granulatum]|uniref:imelysin family protein n=1 Tax=Pontibacterium granulatum TaxID=2036029 RepID=UPI00249BD9FB|nr:imelysin family protein [Pontibacterium granulatum]MDI3324216.1 imelysin family protein [Pontibacterium granulatum]